MYTFDISMYPVWRKAVLDFVHEVDTIVESDLSNKEDRLNSLFCDLDK